VPITATLTARRVRAVVLASARVLRGLVPAEPIAAQSGMSVDFRSFIFIPFASFAAESGFSVSPELATDLAPGAVAAQSALSSALTRSTSLAPQMVTTVSALGASVASSTRISASVAGQSAASASLTRRTSVAVTVAAQSAISVALYVPLLLDYVSTSAAGAYSMRKLRDAYAGACLRLRRSSDNAEQDIGFTGTAIDTTAAAAFIGGDTAYVAKWYDQTTNGRDLVQATASKQPTFATSPARMSFDGVNDTLAVAFTFNQPETFYLAMKQRTWTDGDRIFDGVSINYASFFQGNGPSPILYQYAGSYGAGISSLSINTWGVVSVIFNGASSAVRLNKTTASTGNAGANNAGGIRLAALGNDANFGDIEVSELIACAAAHDSTTQDQIVTNIGVNWGISV
jgi:hypothetical protein